MSDEYDYFMLYDLDDSVNRVRLNVIEEETTFWGVYLILRTLTP